MSTVTTFLNLVKAAIAEQYSVATTNNNLDMIDTHLKDVVAKMSKGRLNRLKNDAVSNGLSGSGVMTDLIAVTLVKDRHYSITYRVDTICPTAANVPLGIEFRKSAVADVTTAGTQLGVTHTIWTAPVMNSGETHDVQVRWKALSDETVNIKAVMTRLSGTAVYDISLRDLSVVDEGAQY